MPQLSQVQSDNTPETDISILVVQNGQVLQVPKDSLIFDANNTITIKELTGTTPTWDATNAKARIDATGNTAITVTNYALGSGILHFRQPSGGNVSLTVNGVVASVNPDPNSYTLVGFSDDGVSFLIDTNYHTGTGSSSNTTPAAPTFNFDAALRIMTISHDTLADSEILYNENGGSFVQYIGAFSVDDFAHAAGYWKAKTKAATGRNESPVSDSPTVNAKGVTSDTKLTFQASALITSPAADVFQGSGTELTSSNFDIGTGLDWKEIATTGDCEITFKHAAADSGGFVLGFSRKEREVIFGDIVIGVHLNTVGEWKTVEAGTYITPNEAAISVGTHVKLQRASGVWSVRLSPDGVAYGSAIRTLAYTGTETLYPVLLITGKIYNPQQAGLTLVSHATPVYTTTGYKTADITEANNGISKNGSNSWSSTYRTVETFVSHDCIRFTVGDATLKDFRVGYTTVASPAGHTDCVFGINLDSDGNVTTVNNGTQGGNLSTYAPGDMYEVHSSRVIKKSSDSGVTWRNISMPTTETPLTGHYGFAALYSAITNVTNIQKR